jgi:hypothetical protein
MPLFEDGFFWRATWELKVDREDSKFSSKDNTDQWLIRERSAKLVALHLECRHYSEMVNGEWFQKAWDSSLEIDPANQAKTVETDTDQDLPREEGTVESTSKREVSGRLTSQKNLKTK